VYLPAWVISSAVHVAMISLMIMLFGVAASEALLSQKIITTSISTPDEVPPEESDSVDFDLQLDVTADEKQLDQSIPQPIRRWFNSRNDKILITNWIRNLDTFLGTVPITGFENVFAMNPPPDVIDFMTDGGFNPKEVAQIKERNMALKKPAVIHTIAFKDRKGEALLRQIALDSKGTFRFVASP
jgi:hypothetical protein